MFKSLTEFQALNGAELSQILDAGPILITDDDEPSFVAQSVEDFEAMVRRIRLLEAEKANRRRSRIHPSADHPGRCTVIPLRR